MIPTMQTLKTLSAIEVVFTTDTLSYRKFIPTIWTNLYNLKVNLLVTI